MLKSDAASPGKTSAGWPSPAGNLLSHGVAIANAEEARHIYKIGEQYHSVDETLAKLGYPPNRTPGQRCIPLRNQSR